MTPISLGTAGPDVDDRGHSGGAPAVGPIAVVVIGAGPAAVMMLERLLARHARETPELRIDVTLVDPYEPGGGRIWRRDQSPLLKLNSMFTDVAFFTDDSCEIDGPIAPGPSLMDWVDLVRAGRAPLPDWADDAIRAEIETATPQSFPTRRLNNAYLGWAVAQTQRRAAPAAHVRWVRDRALAIEAGQVGREHVDAPTGTTAAHIVRLASGGALTADVVVHALGHNGSAPTTDSVDLAAFAERHGLGYVAPGFTADLDFDWVPAGEDVIVRGMGLAAIDLVVLLTEGRGGRYHRTDDGVLVYTPGGEEPVLHLGSRRGVPYRSKITSTLAGRPVQLDYLGDGFHDWVATLDRQLDFDADVWPRVEAEMLIGYYRELFTGHPDRVSGDWGTDAKSGFGGELRAILNQPGGSHSPRLRSFIADHVPHPDDRFDLDSFNRPLTFAGPSEAAHNVHGRVHEHIAQDLRQRTRQEHSATQGLFLSLLHAYFSIAEVPAERWTARSRIAVLPKSWHAFFSYVASGPPGHRLEELLALADAGVVRFLGGDVQLERDAHEGHFVASGSARIAGADVDAVSAPDAEGSTNAVGRTRVVARTLIDAWLPAASAAASDNPLLAQMIRSGYGRELEITDAEFAGTTGQVEVDAVGALPGAPRQFALGPFTSSTTAGAFARPGINSLPFRQHDRIAGAVLAEVIRARRGVVDAPAAASTAPTEHADAEVGAAADAMADPEPHPTPTAAPHLVRH